VDLVLFSAGYLLIGYPLAFGAVAWRRRRGSA
jgi:hypothetical protein